MMPRSRCHAPKIVRPAAFGHTIDYGLETQSSGWDRSSSAHISRTGSAHDLHLRHMAVGSLTRDAQIENNMPLLDRADKFWRGLTFALGKCRWGDPAALLSRWLLRNQTTTPAPDK
jgi:hypothetical protein